MDLSKYAQYAHRLHNKNRVNLRKINGTMTELLDAPDSKPGSK
mgnify:CR=1 FL=1|tara:strand:+ start:179 stop:307 length:129 start_codon:yes stop_codon:yes gene_type:complete